MFMMVKGFFGTLSDGIKEVWKNFTTHTKSSRFCIIILVLTLSFIAAVITAFEPAFPFIQFAGIVNGLGLGAYISKSFGAGEKERRVNNWRNNHEK